MDLVVDGTDGAGKTPLVAALCESLRARGHEVATYAPYRVEEVFPLWQSEPRRAAAIITGHMERFRDAHPRAVIVWDRGWPTAWVSTDDAQARDAFRPLPAVTVLLLNTTRTTRFRAAKHASTAPWMVEDELIERFNAAYRALAGATDATILAYQPGAEDRFDYAPIVLETLTAAGLG